MTTLLITVIGLGLAVNWAMGSRLYYYRRQKFLETLIVIHSKKRKTCNKVEKDMHELEQEWRILNGYK